MDKIEIIAGVERRRQYSDAERTAILAMSPRPKSWRRAAVGHAAGGLHGWRRMRRGGEKLASEPLQFIAYGSVPETVGDALATALSPPAPPALRSAPAEDLMRPHPGACPGAIDVDLPDGICLSVDSYVNEKALARVLRALRDVS